MHNEDNGWGDAACACIEAAIRALSHDTMPTRETAKTVLTLAETARKFTNPSHSIVRPRNECNEDYGWGDAAYACIEAAIRVLSHDTVPTKETAETVLILAEAAGKFAYPYSL